MEFKIVMKGFNNKNRKRVQVLLYLIGLFAFQEIVFRYSFPLPELENFDRVNFLNLYTNGEQPEYLRNQNWYWQSSLDTNILFESQMNHYGFRDNEWLVDKPKGKQRVFFVGDSFVEGIMANKDETITSSFKKLAGEDNYEVFNAGMLGIGLDHYLQFIADATPIFQPDVIFLCIYANDLGKAEPIIPAYFLSPEYFNPIKPRLIELANQFNTRGTVISRWDNGSNPYLPAVPASNNPWTDNESELKMHCTPELMEAMKNATLNSFQTNSLYKEELALKNSALLGETFPFFNFECKKYDIEPVVVYIPSRNQLTDHYLQFSKQSCLLKCSDSINLTAPKYQQHQHEISKQCKALNIQFIDLTETLKTKEFNGEHLYWNYDEHMKGHGYELVGELIWNKWKKTRSLKLSN